MKSTDMKENRNQSLPVKKNCKWFPNSYKLTSISILTLIRAIHANNDKKTKCHFIFSRTAVLLDMKECPSHGSAVGIDRTFNLGACYLTTTKSPNKFVEKRNSEGAYYTVIF